PLPGHPLKESAELLSMLDNLSRLWCRTAAKCPALLTMNAAACSRQNMTAQAASQESAALSREDEQAEVIRRLEEDIISGRFAPGSRLVEDSLMGRYGASRHFVRQALFQLERQGIVLREKNIGATVRFYSAEEVRQIYEVREMLTRQAALMIPL